MNDKYIDTTYICLFFLKRRGSKFLQTSGNLAFHVYLNYKTLKTPISFFINMYIFSSLVYGHPIFDSHGTTKLLICLPELLQLCDHGFFKMAF